jgi:GTPase SAR1 family protein
MKWLNELNSGELRNVPKIVVGNKIDLRVESSP